MVSGLVEKGVDKVTRYWPKCLYNHELKVGDATLGDFKVAVLGGSRKGGYLQTKLRLRYREQERVIMHFWLVSATQTPRP